MVAICINNISILKDISSIYGAICKPHDLSAGHMVRIWNSYVYLAGKPSPWALSKDALKNAQTWIRTSLRLPRTWGGINKILLSPTRADPKKAKKLKAAAAVTTTTSGILALLGTWTADNNWRETQYAKFLGKFAEVTRELTSHEIILEVRISIIVVKYFHVTIPVRIWTVAWLQMSMLVQAYG